MQQHQAEHLLPIPAGDEEYQVSEKVYIRNHVLSNAANNFCAGLALRWIGPFTITEKEGSGVYSVHRPTIGSVKVHSTDMKQTMRAITTAPSVRPEREDASRDDLTITQRAPALEQQTESIIDENVQQASARKRG